VFGWHVKFIVSVPEQGENSSQCVFKNVIPKDVDNFYLYCAECSTYVGIWNNGYMCMY